VLVGNTATVTGNQNIGDWNQTISGTTGAPGWVTTARGDFHLDAFSAALDICTTDGDWDVEGTSRPSGGDWDAGAIELVQP
jgi:hypothetical protein